MNTNDMNPDQPSGPELPEDLIRSAHGLASHTVMPVTSWINARRHRYPTTTGNAKMVRGSDAASLASPASHLPCPS
jgi:hypothetical protein